MGAGGVSHATGEARMGAVAEFARVPEGAWPAVLRGVRAAGVEVSVAGSERGVWWCACERGGGRLGLAYTPETRATLQAGANETPPQQQKEGEAWGRRTGCCHSPDNP
jgi:hypothetical protein